MLLTSMTNKYTAFGFIIESKFPFPELIPIRTEQKGDITIESKDLAQIWERIAESNKYFDVEPQCCLFKIPEVAIFMIEQGCKIFYSPLEDVKEDHIRLYLLGTCMGAILFQRNILPLHGSAVEIDGKAFAFVGHSGAGKSTTASAFLKRGHQLISDDVIPVTIENGVPVVTPAYPQQKLWQESLDEFDMTSVGLRPIVDRETKYAIPVEEKFVTKRLPLAGVIEIEKGEADKVDIHQVDNLLKLHTLFNHTYRNFMVKQMGLMNWHFSLSAQLCEQISLYKLTRPVTYFTANDLPGLILSTLRMEAVSHGEEHPSLIESNS
ncbi:aldolase [Halobacillus campisalis]|uniref:Aldolase n=2 Tax=Halobacillus campisalis TaxID=435909 RepID=A0ABW2K9E8_9BACI|nr:aldolase [Halobacillus campisalis]